MALRYLNDVGEKFVRAGRQEMVQGIRKEIKGVRHTLRRTALSPVRGE